VALPEELDGERVPHVDAVLGAVTDDEYRLPAVSQHARDLADASVHVADVAREDVAVRRGERLETAHPPQDLGGHQTVGRRSRSRLGPDVL